VSDVVRVRIGGVEKNMNRSLALSKDDVLVLDGAPTTRLDGRFRADEPFLAPSSEGTYGGNSKADLEAEIARRNRHRGVDEQLDAKKGTAKEIEAALVADDKAATKSSNALRAAFIEARAAAAATSDAGGSSADANTSGDAGNNAGGTQ